MDKAVLTLEVEPGETYHVFGTATMGMMAGHPDLSPSDAATFQNRCAQRPRRRLRPRAPVDLRRGIPERSTP
jgi:hypothetical protein